MVIAESDSTGVISACTRSTWWSGGAPLFADCMDLIASIGNVNFFHCLRETNQCAHKIAKYSFENNSCCTWVNNPPDFILSALMNDVNICYFSTK